MGPQGISEDAAEMESSNHGLAGCHIPGGAERTEAARSHCHQPPGSRSNSPKPRYPWERKEEGKWKEACISPTVNQTKT